MRAVDRNGASGIIETVLPNKIAVMSDQPQKFEGISFLGLSIAYPRTFWGTLPFGFGCAAIVLVVYFLTPRNAPPRRLWLPTVVDTNGAQAVLAESQQMNFWTPSVHTKDYLSAASTQPADPDRWQVLPNDDQVIQFGKLLHSNSNVLGYRRTEVWGHGRSVFKPGWWWTVNVYTNFSVAEMGQAYQRFWKCSGPVFIEAVQNRGSE